MSFMVSGMHVIVCVLRHEGGGKDIFIYISAIAALGKPQTVMQHCIKT
jgi:hypothetical protein